MSEDTVGKIEFHENDWMRNLPMKEAMRDRGDFEAALIAEQAKNLRLCQTIAKQQKQIDRLSKFVPEIDW